MAEGKKSLEQRLIEKREALKRRAAEVDAELKKLAERKTKTEEARETRRKILFGGWALDQIKRDEVAKGLFDRFLASLKNEQDRRIFGLAPTKEKSADEKLNEPKPPTKKVLEEI